MLPFEVDQDSNFKLEVYCIDGAFKAPIWPEECAEEKVCSVIPESPENEIRLIRADNRKGILFEFPIFKI